MLQFRIKLLLVSLLCLIVGEISAQDIYATSESNSSSGNCLSCSVSNPENAVDSDFDNFSTLSADLASQGGEVEQTLIFPVVGQDGDTIEILMELTDEMELSLGALANISVNSKLATADNNDDLVLSNSAFSVQGGDKFSIRFVTGGDYDRIQVKISISGIGAARSVNLYYAKILNPTIFEPQCLVPDMVAAVENCSGGIPGDCGVFNLQALQTTSPDDFVQLSPSSDFNKSVEVISSWNTLPCAADMVEIIMERLPNNSPGAPRGQITFTAYHTDTVAATQNINLSESTIPHIYSFAPGVEFDSVGVQIVGALGELSSGLKLYTVCLKRLPKPLPDTVLGAATIVCYNDSVSVDWRVGAGKEIVVYSDRERVNEIYSGPAPFVADSLTRDTIFYAATLDTLSNCVSTMVDSIIVDVLPLVPAAIVEENKIACFNTSTTLVPNPFGTPNTFEFFTDSAATNLLFTGGVYVTGTLTADTSFWIRNTYMGMCPEDTIHEQKISIFEEPVIADVLDTIGVCDGDSAAIPVYALSQSSAQGQTITYNVYASDMETPLLDTNGSPASFLFGDTILIPFESFNLASAGDIDSLYVDAVSPVCRESSNKQLVIVKLVDQSVIEAPEVDSVFACLADINTRMFVKDAKRGLRYFWYNTADGQNSFAIGDTVYVPTPDTIVRYYVEANAGVCSSTSRTEVVIIPLDLAGVNYYALDQQVCEGDSAILIAENGITPEGTYTWYGDSLLDSIIFVGDTLIIDAPISKDTTVYLTVSPLQCTSPTVFTAAVSPVFRPNVTIAEELINFCAGDEVTVEATSDTLGAEITWWSAVQGGTKLADTNPYTFAPTANPGEKVTVFAQSNLDLCTSSLRKQVTLQNVDNQKTPSITGEDKICVGDKATLIASSPWQEVNYSWWTDTIPTADTIPDGVLLALSNIYTTDSLFADSVLYAQIEFKHGVCPDRGRTPFAINVKEKLSGTSEVKCTSTTGDAVSFEWRTVENAVAYLVRYQVDNEPYQDISQTDTTFSLNGLQQGQTVTITVFSEGELECELSEGVSASCTAGCPFNNTKTEQGFYEVCQGGTIDVNVDVDVAPEAENLWSITFESKIAGPTKNTTFVYPLEFIQTPDISNILTEPVTDTIKFTMTIDGFSGCDGLEFFSVVKTNPIPDVDSLTAIEAIPLIPPVPGQIIDEYEFIANIPGNVEWLWDFGDGTTSSEISPVHKFPIKPKDDNTPYLVKLDVTNAFGCKSTINYGREILVGFFPEIFIPNTFTPNNDGKNDGFRVFGEGIKLKSLKVFNKYGNVVFETRRLTEVWDGRKDGNEQPMGDYYYVAIISDFLDQEYVREGTVTLVRK